MAGGSPTKTTAQHRLELRRRFGRKVSLLGAYPGRNYAYATYRCQCGEIFKRTPSNMMAAVQGTCPKCADSLSTTEHKVAVFARFGERLRVLGRYYTSKTPIAYRCECGTKFESRPDHVLERIHPCPQCTHKANRAAYDTKSAAEFRRAVDQLTRLNYIKFKYLINPDDLPRSKYGYHLDHVYSIHEAFTNPKGLCNPITVEEVAHPANLVMLSQHENNVKYRFSASTASGLRQNIALFNRLQRQRKHAGSALPHRS